MSSESFVWPVANAPADGFPLLPAFTINSVGSYQWMVIVGGLLAFAMAWGIGANDVANAFATSVGAGSINLPTACVIAAVMEFAGALLLGGEVTDTVRKKMINTDVFDPNQSDGASNGPEVLMTGFLIALFAATIWLITATYFALPVSTTHSIIGALVGVGLAYRGRDAVVWVPEADGLAKLKGVVGVIASWVISPVLSAIFAIIVFLIVRTSVLRRSDPFKNGLIFMPFFYGFTVALAIFFIIFKGDKRFDLSDRLGTGGAVAVALGAGAGFAILSAIIVLPLAKKAVNRWEVNEEEKSKNPDAFKEQDEKVQRVEDALSRVGVNVSIKEELDEDVVRMHDSVEKFDPKTERLFTWVQVFTAAVDAFAHGANDVANSIGPFASIFQLHRNAGVITKPKTSKFDADGTYSGGLRNGQPFKTDDLIPDGKSSCGTSGTRVVDGEDEAIKWYKCKTVFPNIAPGPGTPQTFSLYDKDGAVQTEDGAEVTSECYQDCYPRAFNKYTSNKQGVELWILALGGVGIVMGLAMWGYRIILAIGVKLTKLTPSRGFAIETGAAITVLIASEIGIPVSTTHCQVGATMGVGLVEFKSTTVNWKQFIFICLGWVFTVVFTGVLSAVLFLIIVSSPQDHPVPQGPLRSGGLDFCPGNRVFVYDEEQKGFSGVSCSGTSLD